MVPPVSRDRYSPDKHYIYRQCIGVHRLYDIKSLPAPPFPKSCIRPRMCSHVFNKARDILSLAIEGVKAFMQSGQCMQYTDNLMH